jgi:hypothetical protein
MSDVFVVHTLPDRKRQTFKEYRPAFKEFARVSKTNKGSVALYRGPNWIRLYASPMYPEALSEPYMNADV